MSWINNSIRYLSYSLERYVEMAPDHVQLYEENEKKGILLSSDSQGSLDSFVERGV